MHSEQVAELSAAMAKAQGEIENATYNRINPHFKNKYADLAAVWDAIRKPLSKHGLWVSQTMEIAGDNHSLVLHTVLYHASGQWISSDYLLPSGAKPQEFGSHLTYARRYSLASIVGIAADEDDDANEAQKGHAQVNPPKVAPPTPAAAALIEAAKRQPENPGEPRELPLGDQPDWVRFGQVMIEAAKRPDWLKWAEVNQANLARMENQAPKVYGRMMDRIADLPDAHTG